MKIELRLPATNYVAKESLLLTVVITNDGKSPISVPDPETMSNTEPVYILTGASFPQPATLAFGGRRPDLPPVPPEMVTIAPGEEFECQVPIDMLARIVEKGRHTVMMRMGEVSSNTVAFSIDEPVVVGARIMADDGVQRSPARVLALVGSPGKLIQFLFREQRPAIGEIRFAKMVAAPAPAPPANATDPLAIWTNFDRSEVFYFRTGWVSPDAVGIETGSEAQTVRATLQVGAEVPVHPALMAIDGNAQVFVRSASQLRLLRFPLPEKGQPPAPSEEIWSAPMPASVGSAAAVLSASGKPYALTVGTMAPAPASRPEEEPPGLRVTLFDASGDAKPLDIEIPNAVPVPDSQPAVWCDAEGRVHAALLVLDPPPPPPPPGPEKPEEPEEPSKPSYTLSYVRIDWTPLLEPFPPAFTRKRLPAIAVKPAAAVVSHKITAGSSRVDWVAMLEDRSFLSDTQPGQPQSVAGQPVLPLQVLSMEHAKYLLTLDQNEILKFRNLK